MEFPSNIKVGTCGFRLAKKKYAELFSVLEVQQTFYQPPQLLTLEKWRTEMPQDFEFTMKAWMLITHNAKSPTYRRLTKKFDDTYLSGAGFFRPSGIVEEAWQVSRNCAKVLHARRILFQCPASFTPTPEHIEHMREFFRSINREDFIFLWEPRGKDWSDDLILELCSELHLIHTVDPFVNNSRSTTELYYRLHGKKRYRGSYEDEELKDLADSLPHDQRCYVLFNNIRMAQDAVRFLEILKKHE